MTDLIKYQYNTNFFRAEDYDSNTNINTHLKFILNYEGQVGWRVVSTWTGEQGGEKGIYVLYERPYTGEFPE